jgi:leucyl-tRNA synthetase
MVCHETYKDKKGKWLHPNEVEKKSDGSFFTIKNKERVVVGPSESMSKSKKNTVDPEDMINAYGADSIRWFILSDSPPERDIQWSLEGVSASYKFIQKLWKLNSEILNKKDSVDKNEDNILEKAVNKTIFKVTKNLESFQYNVVIANIHEIYNLMNQHVINNKTSNDTLVKNWKKIIMILMPVVPHLAHEMSEKIGVDPHWPKFDNKLLEEQDCVIVVQVDGRKRGSFKISLDSKENILLEKAQKIENVSKYIEKNKIIKNIYIKNKLINFITKK